MRNYCILITITYLGRALALYESLKNVSPAFHLYVFCYDDVTLDFFQKINLEFITALPITDLEDGELQRVKKGRTVAEYCWTCKAPAILYCIQTFNLPECSYLDADVYFFSDPEELYAEIPEDKSILITPHRFMPDHDLTATCGRYCAQMITCKNTPAGLNVMRWWKDKCIEWCFNWFEDGKTGDQKYLDDWLVRFPGVVHELEHAGGGVAPWNVRRYLIDNIDGVSALTDLATGRVCNLVFYHFHHLKFNREAGYFHPSPFYSISSRAYEVVYKPYLLALIAIMEEYSEVELTDFPVPAREIGKEQFENEILPNASRYYEQLRTAYLYNSKRKTYCYIKSLEAEADITRALIAGKYHLSRESDINHSLREANDQLELKKAYSLLWPHVDPETRWQHTVFSSLNDITKDTFAISFPYFLPSIRTLQIAWQPMRNVYCAIRLKAVEAVTGDGKVMNMDLADMKHNGILQEDGWVEFLRLNCIFYLLAPPGNTVRLIFKGDWKRFEYWQLGEKVVRLMQGEAETAYLQEVV